MDEVTWKRNKKKIMEGLLKNPAGKIIDIDDSCLIYTESKDHLFNQRIKSVLEEVKADIDKHLTGVNIVVSLSKEITKSTVNRSTGAMGTARGTQFLFRLWTNGVEDEWPLATTNFLSPTEDAFREGFPTLIRDSIGNLLKGVCFYEQTKEKAKKQAENIEKDKPSTIVKA
jgi:hypothetical protein